MSPSVHPTIDLSCLPLRPPQPTIFTHRPRSSSEISILGDTGLSIKMEVGSSSSKTQQTQDRVPCANIKQVNEASVNCGNYANLQCGKCHLVHYCDRSCQISHWPQHKLDCNSGLRKVDWKPTWEREGRNPSFVGDGAPFVTFGHVRYLWGNVPAFDVFNLPQNEGAAYDRDLNICFAGEFFSFCKGGHRVMLVTELVPDI